MSNFRRIAILLIFLNIPLGFILYGACYNQYLTRRYWLAYLIKPVYDYIDGFLLSTIFVILLAMLLCIIAYIVKSEKKAKVFVIIALVLTLTESAIVVNEYYFAYKARTYFNPETVQSTMVEIDLQQLEDLQNNEETTMIYFGRPSCAHCSEIKPNLDILVNNSHSLVYYYNTEQDRDDNHDEMQAVLDIYGVAAVPALVVWADAGKTQEVYFNEDIVDYFLDTSRFSY